MNRRDFLKLVGKAAAGAIIVPMLPKPMTNKVLPPQPSTVYPSGTAVLDSLWNTTPKPDVLLMHPDTWAEMAAVYDLPLDAGQIVELTDYL